MKWRKNKKQQRVEHYNSAATQQTLAEILMTHDLVEVIPNDGDPVVIVAQRPSERQSLSSDIVFAEPSADERSMGYPVRTVVGANSSSNSQQSVALAERRTLGPNNEQITRGVQYVSINELGSSSPSPWISFNRREYNRALDGLNGLKIYDQMRRNDGTIKGTLRGVKTPVLSARWFIEACDKNANGEVSVADKNAANFIWKNLTELMSIGWTQVLTEALLSADFGYYMFEIVWDEKVVDGQDRIIVSKLAPRHPMDVKEWFYDANGGPVGVLMYDSEGNWQDDVYIPIDKLLVFTFDREAGNIEGISVLRAAYKHWYFKEQLYKIDAIQKERHGIGVPVIKLPPGFTDEDKRLAENMGRNLRTNERAHVTLPPLWDISFAKLEGQPVDALKSIDMHDKAIRESVLLNFMDPAHSTNEEDQMMFLKAQRFIADIICETFNLYLIPKIIDANFQRVGSIKLRARRIGEQADWRTLSFAIRNLIGCGALVPDDPLEEMLREEMDLPAIDFASRRLVATDFNKNDPNYPPTETAPSDAAAKDVQAQAYQGMTADGRVVPSPPTTKQNGATAGLPRQAKTAPNSQPKANAGLDRSGG